MWFNEGQGETYAGKKMLPSCAEVKEQGNAKKKNYANLPNLQAIECWIERHDQYYSRGRWEQR
jgi:hypothetical protein